MRKISLTFLILSCILTLNIAAQDVREIDRNIDLVTIRLNSDPKVDEFAALECTCHPIERKSHLLNRQSAHGLMIRTEDTEDTSSSLNWSGYVALTGTSGKPNPTYNSVTQISGSWSVPTLTSNPGCDSFSAAWVGIDGYSNSVVEQIGTEHDVINGQPSYYAWFSLYPAPTQVIDGFPVNPGDMIEGKVSYQGQDDCGNSVFNLVIKNRTQKVQFCTVQHTLPGNPAHLSSADWIVESPAIVDPRIPCINLAFLPLANFTTISFDQCKATINGRSGDINNKHWTFDAITMVTEARIVKAQPTALETKCSSRKGSSFDVLWKSAGPCPYEEYCPPIVP